VGPLGLDRGPGGVLWVTGTNGSGKSSLLRTLAGVDPAASGRVERWGRLSEAVTWVHPAMSLPRQLKVGDWLRMVRSARSVTLPDGIVPEVPSTRRVRDLSTGEAKRLILAAALSHAREFVFLDEPFEHLSPDAKEALARALRSLQETRVVVVATNQDLPAAETGDEFLRLETRP